MYTKQQKLKMFSLHCMFSIHKVISSVLIDLQAVVQKACKCHIRCPHKFFRHISPSYYAFLNFGSICSCTQQNQNQLDSFMQQKGKFKEVSHLWLSWEILQLNPRETWTFILLKRLNPFILDFWGDDTGEATIRWWDLLKPTKFLLLPIDTKGECVHKGKVPPAASCDTSPQKGSELLWTMVPLCTT